jgi:hypothetical protein
VTEDARLIPTLRASAPRIDTSRANVARAWNYMVGGKGNFEATWQRPGSSWRWRPSSGSPRRPRARSTRSLYKGLTGEDFTKSGILIGAGGKPATDTNHGSKPVCLVLKRYGG